MISTISLHMARARGFSSSPEGPSGNKPPSIYEQAKLNELKQLQESYNSGEDNSHSIQESDKERSVLEDTVTFPALFTIKIIGVNEPTFAPDVVSAVSAETGILPETMQISSRETSGGKYVSITLITKYQSADEVYKAYAVIGKDPRVKYVI